MIERAARAPGLAFEVVRTPVEPSALRSDIAAFVGPTRRGPLGVATRVEGWREYRRAFGELDRDHDTPYAIRGYFENGGEVAWILRCAPPRARLASALWDANGLAALGNAVYRIWASSPGPWANGARVTLRYRGRTTTGTANVDVSVRTSDETEELRAIPAAELVTTINASRLIRIEPVAPPTTAATPRAFAVDVVTLDHLGSIEPAAREDYLDAIDALADVPEAALVAFPDLHDLAAADATKVFHAAAASADNLHDRLVLVDLPREAPRVRWHVDDILTWVRDTLARDDDDKSRAVRWWRAAALYHPWVRVSDPLGGVAQPARDIPPCGHVAGVISKLAENLGARPLSAAGAVEPHQAHHLIPDEVVRKNPLLQLAREKAGYNLDRASNGVYLPETAAARDATPASKGLPLHRGSHPTYSQLADDLANKELADLIEAYGSADKIPPDELGKAVTRVEGKMRDIINKWITLYGDKLK